MSVKFKEPQSAGMLKLCVEEGQSRNLKPAPVKLFSSPRHHPVMAVMKSGA